MITYNLDEINIKRFEQHYGSFDIKESLCSIIWFCFTAANTKEKYFFHQDGRITVTNQGEGKEGKWEWSKKQNIIEIVINGKAIMLHPSFYLDKSILACSLDETNKYVIFVNSQKKKVSFPNQSELIQFLLEKQSTLEETDEQKSKNKKKFNLTKQANKIADNLMPWWYKEKAFACVFLLSIIPSGSILSNLSYYGSTKIPFILFVFLEYMILMLFFTLLYYIIFRGLARCSFDKKLKKWKKENPNSELIDYICFY